MANIIDAIINLTNVSNFTFETSKNSNNRINAVGDNLEEFVKLLFVGTFDLEEDKKLEKISEVFSYLGNKNNPPDAMLKGGDAIEIKKIELNKTGNIATELQLNSSHPKQKLYSNSKLISAACKTAEKWDVKDMLYVIGVMKNKTIKDLFFVDGITYAADEETYLKIKNSIKDTIENDLFLECTKTNELARINKVDPLGITSLRVRGMWLLKNPWETFNYIYKKDNNKSFNFCAIITKEKYETFENRNILEKLSFNSSNLKIEDKKVKDPNNTAKSLDIKMITISL